jgi:hypothetical protein
MVFQKKDDKEQEIKTDDIDKQIEELKAKKEALEKENQQVGEYAFIFLNHRILAIEERIMRIELWISEVNRPEEKIPDSLPEINDRAFIASEKVKR